MYKFIIRRLILLFPAVFLVSILVFFAAASLPGDPSLQEVMNRPDSSAEDIARIRERYNLDKPIPERYLIWVTDALQGDFGTSFIQKRSVLILIQEKLFNTFFLGLTSLFFIFTIGIPLGIIAAKNEGKLIDKAIVGYSFITIAVPSFVLGILFLYFFGYVLGWFPTSGSIDPYIYDQGTITQKFFSRVYHALLPAFTIGILATTTIIQYLRNEIIRNKDLDFVKTIRAKGQKENIIYYKHVLRNSLLPISSVLGFYITGIFAGSIIVESIFSYPGIGKFFMDSITQRDTPVVVALTLFMSLLTLFGSLISDIFIVLVDPRVRIE